MIIVQILFEVSIDRRSQRLQSTMRRMDTRHAQCFQSEQMELNETRTNERTFFSFPRKVLYKNNECFSVFLRGRGRGEKSTLRKKTESDAATKMRGDARRLIFAIQRVERRLLLLMDRIAFRCRLARRRFHSQKFSKFLRRFLVLTVGDRRADFARRRLKKKTFVTKTKRKRTLSLLFDQSNLRLRCC